MSLRRCVWIIQLSCAALLVGRLAPATLAVTVLNPGDIAIVGFSSDDLSGSGGRPKEVAFVTFVPLEASTIVSFTDNGWLSPDERFRTGEGVTTFTVPAGGLSAGTVVVLPGVAGGFNLSASGDQVFAFQGSIDGLSGSLTGTLLHGVNVEGAGVWQASATSANTSAQPAALSGNLSIARNELDNGAFNSSVLSSGTRDEWLSAIANPANWSLSDTTQPAMPAGPLVVVPEPGSAGFILSGIAVVALRRRFWSGERCAELGKCSEGPDAAE